MRGYVLLRSNPYMGTSDASGRVEFTNLPTGRHKFQIWHERAGYVPKVRVGPATASRKGRVSLLISKGKNEFGDVRISSEILAGSAVSSND